MSAYKKLNKQDAYITTYNAHKPWALSGSQFSSYGITLQSAGSGYTLQNLQQLYYKTKSSNGTIPSHSFDLYNQSTLFFSSSRNLTTGSQIFSIPRQLYGANIRPGTFKVTIPPAEVRSLGPIDIGFMTDGYIQGLSTFYIDDFNGTGETRSPSSWDPIPDLDPIRTRPPIERYVFQDDAEGNLYLSGSNINQKVGDIIYPHGMAIVTDSSYTNLIRDVFRNIRTRTKVTMSFENTQPIFTHNYHCKIRESEYNFTYNPSALSSSLKTVYDNNGDLYSTSSMVGNGVLNSNVTGSTFQPYITAVGLYNDANQLIAVGKMPRPVPKSANTEMTIIVKIDI
jgi:hypothetical protein